MASSSLVSKSATQCTGPVIVLFIVNLYVLCLFTDFVHAETYSQNDLEERKIAGHAFDSFNLNNIQQELANGGVLGVNQVSHLQQSDRVSERRNVPSKTKDLQLNTKLLDEAELLSQKLKSIVNTELGYNSMQVNPCTLDIHL